MDVIKMGEERGSACAYPLVLDHHIEDINDGLVIVRTARINRLSSIRQPRLRMNIAAKQVASRTG